MHQFCQLNKLAYVQWHFILIIPANNFIKLYNWNERNERMKKSYSSNDNIKLSTNKWHEDINKLNNKWYEWIKVIKRNKRRRTQAEIWLY